MEEPSNLLLQNKKLHDEVKRRIDQITAINTVSATVSHSLDLNITLHTAMEATLSVVGAEAAGISLIDEEAGEVVLRAQLGWINDFVKRNPMRIPLGKGMSGQVIDSDDVVVHNNLTGDEEYAVKSFRKEAFRSIAMAPIHARNRIIGILSIMSHRPDRFDAELVNVLKSIADTVGIAIENARLYEQHVEQENRLAAILHSTADGIIATEQNSRIRLINREAARMLDVDASELLGVPLREASINVKIRDQLLKALASPNADSTQTFQVTIEGGPQLFVLVSPVRIKSQVVNVDGMDGWVIVLQDISHLRAAEIARVQFIQAAAHDMKNPLSVTQSSLSMLSGMLPTQDETISEVISIAQSSIVRVQRLIDDLLQIEKIESGFGFNLDDIDVREMCYELAAQTSPLIHQQGQHFQIEISPDVPRMMSLDREWVQRALQNYLENATKYSEPGGAIVFNVHRNNDDILFEVSDNGPGIPSFAQTRIFDRFFRVGDRKEIRGSGLGLAIVKSVAEAHGGQVYLQSKEGEGSIFGMKIPLNAASADTSGLQAF